MVGGGWVKVDKGLRECWLGLVDRRLVVFVDKDGGLDLRGMRRGLEELGVERKIFGREETW